MHWHYTIIDAPGHRDFIKNMSESQILSLKEAEFAVTMDGMEYHNTEYGIKIFVNVSERGKFVSACQFSDCVHLQQWFC